MHVRLYEYSLRRASHNFNKLVDNQHYFFPFSYPNSKVISTTRKKYEVGHLFQRRLSRADRRDRTEAEQGRQQQGRKRLDQR